MQNIEKLLRDLAKTLENHAKRIRKLESLPSGIGSAGAPPALHATTHQNGGSDEINVGGLSGQLADAQQIEILDEGVSKGLADSIDFIGSTVVAAVSGGAATITVTAPTSTINVKEEGVSVGNASILDFVGTFTTATFGGSTATITTAITNFTIGFVVPGTLVVGSGTVRMHAPRAGTITNVTATVNTQPTGASVIVDVNKNGVTIFTTQANRPTIAASSNDDLSSTPDVTSFSQNDVITVDIDQIGSTIAGADLVVQVRYTA